MPHISLLSNSTNIDLDRLAGDQKEGEAAENEASSSSPLERKAKTLRKKIKQAEVLTDRRQAGEKLTEQEAEKVQKAATW